MLRRFLRSGLGISVLFLALAGPAKAESVLLKLGDIKGESTVAGHIGEIDVLSWSWGGSNPTAMSGKTGADLATGKVSLTELTVMKALDASTPKLFEYVTRATHAPSAILTVRRGDGFEYLKITLTDVIVSTLQLSGSTERPNENVGLSFTKVLVQYRPSGTTAWISASWDVASMAP